MDGIVLLARNLGGNRFTRILALNQRHNIIGQVAQIIFVLLLIEVHVCDPRELESPPFGHPNGARDS